MNYKLRKGDVIYKCETKPYSYFYIKNLSMVIRWVPDNEEPFAADGVVFESSVSVKRLERYLQNNPNQFIYLGNIDE